MRTQFETLGYSIDYHVDGKYIGSVTVQEPDRETVGYAGRITSVATEDIKFKTKRIKKGTTYYTFMYPLNGKRI